MSTVLEPRTPTFASPARRTPAFALAAAAAALYVPTCVALARGAWRDEAYAHGPIVLAACAFLAWRGRGALAERGEPAPVAGALLLALGLLAYVIGRSQGLMLFEAGSALPVVAGALLLVGGVELLRRFAVPLALLFFVVPLPGFIIEAVTAPLKTAVSIAVAAIAPALGFPVERSGVVLAAGPHQLLVADACSGMHSIFSLLALALVYAQLTPPAGRARLAWLVASVVPIALLANLVRVLFLVAATYWWGEGVLEGAAHTAIGMVVFLGSLFLLIGVDRLVTRRAATAMPVEAATTAAQHRGRASPAILAAIAAAMAGAVIAAPILKPVATPASVDLERLLPRELAGWRPDPDAILVPPAPDVEAKLDRLYGQVVNRAYVDAQGRHIMLTVAYGGDQSDALKAHRQEVCYEAQGFEVRGVDHGTLYAGDRAVPVTRFYAVGESRSEPVTYWFTMGDRVVLGRFERLQAQLAAGLRGRIPDGFLVRVSSLSNDVPGSFDTQAAFATALLAALPPEAAGRLAGRAPGS